MTILWKHQERMVTFAKPKPATYLSAAMGTGKSLVIVELVKEWRATRVLILCPTSVRGVWRREFNKHAEGGPTVLVLDEGSANDKAKLVRKALTAATDNQLIVVCNYESAWRGDLAKLLESQEWSLVILDEAHRIKSPQGKASKFCAKLAHRSNKRLCLSGTPAPHSPLDLWAQFRFLDPEIFGKSFVQFRTRYAITDRMFPSRVLRWINQDELHEKFSRLAIQVNNDVLDLPPITHQVIPIELGSVARKHYRSLEEEFLAELESGTLTVANALVKSLRLRQCTSGFLTHRREPPEAYETAGYEPIRIEVNEFDDAKEAALSDLIEGLGSDLIEFYENKPVETVVVFCCFRHELTIVERVAEKLGRVYGEVSGARKDLTDHAQIAPETQVLGVQIQAGGLGVDFSKAAYCVYLSLPWSLGEYEQSVARLHRPGQLRHTHCYYLVAENTIDVKVREALDKRRQVVEHVLHGMTRKEVSV